jgi:hypothetical protein
MQDQIEVKTKGTKVKGSSEVFQEYLRRYQKGKSSSRNKGLVEEQVQS